MPAAAAKIKLEDYAWYPQPGPQFFAYTAKWCPELLYGGAKFGGKSDFLLGDYLQDVPKYGRHWQGILIRQSLPELEEIIRRSKELYPATGGEWHKTEKTWTWENGAALKFRYLERPDDFDNYNGHSYPWIGFDELGQWASPAGYHLMKGCLRWGACEIPDMRIRATANPGGRGHQWVRAYFEIDKYPLGSVPIKDEDGWVRIFILSKIENNQIGLKRNPGYIRTLHRVGGAALVRAWLEGDWSQITGAYFPQWSAERHIVAPFEIPKHWTRFRAYDHGRARPFSVGWYAISDGTISRYPAGAMIKYREWYGATGPDIGLRLEARQIAEGIKAKQGEEQIAYSVADPSIFDAEDGPCVAEDFRLNGVAFRPADNSRQAGAMQVSKRLTGDGDGRPMLYFFSTCVDSIRTFPALQHDETKPEDVDTDSEDHAYDETRYACMSRPWVTAEEKLENMRGLERATFNEVLQNTLRTKSKYKRL